MEQFNSSKYGLLYGPDIKLQRSYFKEMTKLMGVNVIVKTPREQNKHYTSHGELESNYNEPILVGCIFDEYPEQKTLKKLHWVSELQENASIIHLPFDLENLQQGTLVIVPSGLDKKEGRVFRVVEISLEMIYPASVACKIVPEWENSAQKSEVQNFTHTDMNMLWTEEDEQF